MNLKLSSPKSISVFSYLWVIFGSKVELITTVDHWNNKIYPDHLFLDAIDVLYLYLYLFLDLPFDFVDKSSKGRTRSIRIGQIRLIRATISLKPSYYTYTTRILEGLSHSYHL